VGREVSGSDEASQMWQRWDIVCRGEDGLEDTARDSGQTASTGKNGRGRCYLHARLASLIGISTTSASTIGISSNSWATI
jgi:hypothetical protein